MRSTKKKTLPIYETYRIIHNDRQHNHRAHLRGLHIIFFVFSKEIHSIKLGFGILLNFCLMISIWTFPGLYNTCLIQLKKQEKHNQAQHEQVTAATYNNPAGQNHLKTNFHE